MTDLDQATRWVQREAAACQRFIEAQQQRFAARDFAAQSCRELYYDLDHTRRWLRWYKAKNKHYFVTE